MLAAPGDLDGDALRGALARGWGLGVASMEYLAVGWGSHHWDVRDEGGGRWLVTVDELETKRVSDAQSVDDGFDGSVLDRYAAATGVTLLPEFPMAPTRPGRGNCWARWFDARAS